LHGTTNVVLTPLGAERIGVQTAPVAALPRRSAQGALSVVPYSAVLYLLNGTPVVYTSPSRLTYTRVPVAIDHISGNQVYITSGPRPGSAVVIVGGEELLGVQEGVEQQS
jgi:multidrug efflux pump subunit AcrA (membrane-fusion protein)